MGLARAGGLGWVASPFVLRPGAQWLVTVRSDEGQRALPPWSSQLGPGGLSRGPGPCDRALTWGGRAGGRREPGPGLRGAPWPLLPGLRALRTQPALRLQEGVDTERQRAGRRAVPAKRPEPRGVHGERRRGHARAGGLVAAGDLEATGPSGPYKKAASLS